MSTDKVVGINASVAVTPEGTRPAVDPEFVKLAESLLERVKSGDIVSVYATGFRHDGNIFRFAYFVGDGQYESIGIIEAMKQFFLDMINERPG
jgi:hypothetical protein